MSHEYLIRPKAVYVYIRIMYELDIIITTRCFRCVSKETRFFFFCSCTEIPWLGIQMTLNQLALTLYIIYFSSFAPCAIGTRVTCTAVINLQGPTKTGGCHRRRCVEVGLSSSTNLRIILRAAIYIIYACRRGRNAQSHVSPGKRCENNPVNFNSSLRFRFSFYSSSAGYVFTE